MRLAMLIIQSILTTYRRGNLRCRAMEHANGNRANGGLEGVVAAETRLSMVDGERGELIVAGHRLEQLARRPSRRSSRCSGTRRASSRRRACRAAALPAATLALLRDAAGRRVAPMDALRMAAGTLTRARTTPRPRACSSALSRRSSRRTRGCSAARSRSRRARTSASRRTTSTCSTGAEPHAERVRGARDLSQHRRRSRLQRVDVHRARDRLHAAPTSSRPSPARSARSRGRCTAARPGPALDMVFEIGDADARRGRAAPKLERGERLMGFGHRVYKVRDPRADVLAAAAARMFTRAGDCALYELARAVESDGAAAARASTSRAGGSRPTSSSTPRCCCSASARHRVLHADVRDRPRRGLDGALPRAARDRPADPPAERLRGRRIPV